MKNLLTMILIAITFVAFTQTTGCLTCDLEEVKNIYPDETAIITTQNIHFVAIDYKTNGYNYSFNYNLKNNKVYRSVAIIKNKKTLKAILRQIKSDYFRINSNTWITKIDDKKVYLVYTYKEKTKEHIFTYSFKKEVDRICMDTF